MKKTKIVGIFLLGLIGFQDGASANWHCPPQIEQKCKSPSGADPYEGICYSAHESCSCPNVPGISGYFKLVCSYDPKAGSPPPSPPQNPPRVPTNPRLPRSPLPYNAEAQQQSYHQNLNKGHLIKIGYTESQTLLNAQQNNYVNLFTALVQAGYSPERINLEHERLSPDEFTIWAQNRIQYKIDGSQKEQKDSHALSNKPLTQEGL